MRFFQYGRKSIFSDKSDSVDNQSRMCRSFIDAKYAGRIESWETYSDEDYTGANTQRPGLQAMLSAIRDDEADALVVYQLDRLSRDVRDFSNIYELLTEHDVEFISIKENIDTTTPIGRAMMYVTVVFAQMERETIAQRVSDNMLGLAKKGYWTGGNPGPGFVRKRIEAGGKKHVTLEPDPETVPYVLKVFSTFLDGGFSLQGLETYFRQQGIRTLRGAFFSTAQLHKLLTTPYYAPDTPEIYDYYEAAGYKMDPDSPREKWDGSHGVIIYGRTNQKSGRHEVSPVPDRLVCIGYHQPIVPAETWLAAQRQLQKNTFIRKTKYDVPLLKGVLRCAHCGTLMQVSRKKLKSGIYSGYFCLKRMRQGSDACPMGMIDCRKLDEKVMEVFRKIEADPDEIRKYIREDQPKERSADPAVIRQKITSQEARIGRLTTSLGEAAGSSAQRYIVAEIERQDATLQDLKQQLIEARREEKEKKREAAETSGKVDEIRRLIQGMDSFTAEEKNRVAKAVLKECRWDGKTLFLSL